MKKFASVLFLVVAFCLTLPSASSALTIGISGRPMVVEKAEFDQIAVILGQVEADAWMFAWYRRYPMEQVYVRSYYLSGHEDMVGARVYFRDSENTEYMVIELTYDIWGMRVPTAVEAFVDHLMNRWPTKRAILSVWQQAQWIDYVSFERQKKTAFLEQMEKKIGWHIMDYD